MDSSGVSTTEGITSMTLFKLWSVERAVVKEEETSGTEPAKRDVTSVNSRNHVVETRGVLQPPFTRIELLGCGRAFSSSIMSPWNLCPGWSKMIVAGDVATLIKAGEIATCLRMAMRMGSGKDDRSPERDDICVATICDV